MPVRTITQILFEDGPQTVADLEHETGREIDELSAELADMIMERRAHLESDLTIWYAECVDG